MKDAHFKNPAWVQNIPPIAGLQQLPEPWTVDEVRTSAVCMLFCPPASKDAEPEVIFIRRAAQLRSHSGQIGFPGGRRDPDDYDPLATALRETEEELGIPPAAIQTLGALPPVRSLDGQNVWPIVGYTTYAVTDLQLNLDEVANAFSVPWREVSLQHHEDFSFTLFGKRRSSVFFNTSKARIWGLTAHMLKSAGLG